MSPQALIPPLVAFAVVVILVWLAARMTRRALWRSPERQLARMMGPDGAERLIRFEQNRSPGLSRRQAARRALERAEYERSR